MSNCKQCGAPLNGLQPICPYCKTKNSFDLSEVSCYTVIEPITERDCPVCDTAMETIDIGDGERFYIEHCKDCGGLFFDLGELQLILKKKVNGVHSVNYKALEGLLTGGSNGSDRVVYRKCPVCQKLMNRENFGARSGVIMDKCHDHGIWLNGGELQRLLEWKKAGGEIHSEKMKAQMAQEKAKVAEQKYREMSRSSGDTLFDRNRGRSSGGSAVFGSGTYGSYGKKRSAGELIFDGIAALFDLI